MRIRIREIELGVGVALFGRSAIPADGFRVVFGDAFAARVGEAETELGLAISIGGGLAEPACGFDEIERNAVAGRIGRAKFILRPHVAGIGGFQQIARAAGKGEDGEEQGKGADCESGGHGALNRPKVVLSSSHCNSCSAPGVLSMNPTNMKLPLLLALAALLVATARAADATTTAGTTTTGTATGGTTAPKPDGDDVGRPHKHHKHKKHHHHKKGEAAEEAAEKAGAKKTSVTDNEGLTKPAVIPAAAA